MTTTPESGRLATRRTGQLALATLAWLATLALVQFGPEFLWGRGAAPSWVALALNLVAGAVWILVHVRYLRAAGELQRKVLLDASGLALGIGLVLGCALTAADGAGLISLRLDVALFIILVAVVYLIATVIGNLRYR
jgi:hypothetical protein